MRGSAFARARHRGELRARNAATCFNFRRQGYGCNLVEVLWVTTSR